MTKYSYVLLWLIMLLSINSFAQWTRQDPVSPFESIPQVVQEISDATSKAKILSLYDNFEKEYPYDKFKSVSFLIDQVNLATAEKMLTLQDPWAVLYLFRISNNTLRYQKLEKVSGNLLSQGVIDSARKDLSQTRYSEHKEYKSIEMFLFAKDESNAWEELRKFDSDFANADKHPFLYARLLADNGAGDLSIKILSDMVRTGNADTYTKDKLHYYWVKENGKEDGYSVYFDSLINVVREQKKDEIESFSVDFPAPMFSIRDLGGNLVRLKELRGKVVVLDFWATWCGPCLKSFPGMKKVIDYYSKEKKVEFLFVNTSEEAEGRQDRIRRLINDKQLDFKILMDEPNDLEERGFELASKYKVPGLPTQIVIDKNGTARFKIVGNSGAEDGMVEELKLIINKALTY